MLPPIGFFEFLSIFTSASAREFTRLLCPKESCTMMGRAVCSESSIFLETSTPFGCMPYWNQCPTTSKESGPAFLSASRHAWIRAWNCVTVSDS